MIENNRVDYIEIDLKFILQKVFEKKVMIILLTSLITFTTFFVNFFFITPRYSSITKIYVVSKQENQELTIQDFQLGDYLVNDYKQIILSRNVLSEVIKEEKLDVSVLELQEKITVDIPNRTRIISITVEHEDPKLARDIANTLREISSDKIKELTNVDNVAILEDAQISSDPSKPNTKKNTAISFGITLLLLVFGIISYETLNDKIRWPDDVEERLKLPLLGFIPYKKR